MAEGAAVITHPIPAFYDEDSRILILGSFPSVKSREQLFFYGHPQNRFWKVLTGVCTSEELINTPGTVDEKKAFLREHHIALWDVIASCRITFCSSSWTRIHAGSHTGCPRVLRVRGNRF